MDKKVTLKKSARLSGRCDHPWIYRSQIEKLSGDPLPGDLVGIFGKRGFVGVGYYNPRSEITIRLLSAAPTAIDKEFFKRKIQKAVRYRELAVKETNACRLIASEADGLPGFIVDRYGEVLVVQFLTMGMERLRPPVLEALKEVIPFKGIYERSDTALRSKEGLEAKKGWIEPMRGEETIIQEGNIRYGVRFEAGQKTGLYLDQRENRLEFGKWGFKGEVLDAFCYEGGFALHLALAGCRALGIDSSEEAVKQAEKNRELNGIAEEACVFKAGNIFDELRRMEREAKRFDLVVLDPPSFVKSKEALEGALKGYKEIILRSMKLLKQEGFLAVFSCSYHVDDNLLMQVSQSAAWDVRKRLRVVRFLKQSADHPIDPFIPETYYLKGFLFWVGSIDSL
ncbi:MAG: class I SAM-dependent rRNA methyltransferase [Candidatus Omnitrophica bacterium]|nr:class I SAM-dependent rRNA methyltransferase [Candidatus Omnitrophota bacterium]